MTLYLSRLRLVTWRGDVAADLEDCCKLHQRLVSVFEPIPNVTASREANGLLFRLESPGVLLVQSLYMPDWTGLPKGYVRDVEAKEVNPQLARGMYVRFRLRAVAAKSIPRGDGRHSVRVPILDTAERRAWLAQRALAIGMQIADMGITRERHISGIHRTKQRVTLSPAMYEGNARVVDALALQTALATGVGSGKAYGCGLLSLARIQEED